MICIEYRVPMVCNLFGAKIKLGMCKIIAANLISCDLADVKKQADTFMDGDIRRLTMKYVNNHQVIVLLREGSEKDSPEVKSLLRQMSEKVIRFEIAPQKLTLGNGLFEPDFREASRLGWKLEETLTPVIRR